MSKRGFRRGMTRRTATALLCACAGIVGLVTVVPAVAAPKPPNPPPKVTDQQVQGAQDAKSALAAKVGELAGEVATAQTQLQTSQAQAELAGQKYDYAEQLYEQAQQKATAAKAQVDSAQAAVTAAQTQYVMYAQSVYMNGSIGGTTGSLLTASDPNVLLEQTALQNYETSHQVSAIGQLQKATVARSNADASARQAEQQAAKLKDQAEQAKNAAAAAAEQAQVQEEQLTAQLATQQAALTAARDELNKLTLQRAAYTKWKQLQDYLARQARLKKEREEAARKAAEAARKLREQQERQRQQQQQQNQNHGTSTNTHTNSGSDAPVVPTGGSWTAAKGQAAVNRAMNWQGQPYAWAGGNANGPTYGVCAGDGAWNDCNIVGFDCSGLTLYAWAPYTSLYHYTVVQYNEGSFHPSPGQFMPGDLLFWSYNGSLSGVHHVALYIGNGNVIQAPQSGDIVRVTPWQEVSSGYYGATRPLT